MSTMNSWPCTHYPKSPSIGYNRYSGDPEDNDYHCSHCEDKEEQLSGAAEWLVNVLDILYGNEPFDALELERALDEMSSYLEVKTRLGDVQVKSIKQ